MNWTQIVGDVAEATLVGLAIYAALSLAFAVRRWIRAQAEKANSLAVRAEAEAELKLAKARSLNADTDDFVRQTAPAGPTVH